MKDMKYNLLTLTVMLCTLASYAQVPNGHFENWSTISTPTVEEWFSLGNVSKTSDAYSGNSAVRLENDGTTESFGILTNAEISENFNGGHPFTDNPLVITFAVKYDLAAGDVGKVYAIFKKQGQLIAAVDFTVNGNSGDTFEVYKVPISMGYSNTSGFSCNGCDHCRSAGQQCEWRRISHLRQDSIRINRCRRWYRSQCRF